jgi:hypothetical protein
LKPISDLARFDPHKLAHFETENYKAYYRKRWLRLLWVSVSMVKEAYQLSLLQAIYGAYLVARAEIAAAPFPKNDIPRAEAFIQSFFRFLGRIYPLDYDVSDAARQEVNWWVVHRKLFAQEQNQELVEALANASAAFFSMPSESLRSAAVQRARGMLYSDQWVRSGMEENSALLEKEEEALWEGYQQLKATLLQKIGKGIFDSSHNISS